MKSRNAQSIVRSLTIAVSLCIIAHLSLGSNAFAGETKTSDEGVDNARLVKATQTADEKTEEGVDSARPQPLSQEGVDSSRLQTLNQEAAENSFEGIDTARQLAPVSQKIIYILSGKDLILSYSPELILQTSTSLGPNNWRNVTQTETPGQYIVPLSEPGNSSIGFYRLVNPK